MTRSRQQPPASRDSTRAMLAQRIPTARRLLLRPLQALLLLLATGWFGATAVQGQSLPQPGQAAPEAQPAAEPTPDPLGRETPRGLVFGFLRAVGEGDYKRASSYLDLEVYPEASRPFRGRLLARDLQQLLDRSGGILGNWQLSTSPEGHTNDDLDPGVDRIGVIRTANGIVDLMAERQTAADGAAVWLVAGETLERVPQLLTATQRGLIDRILPERLTGTLVLGVPVGHWLAMVVLAALCLGLTRVLIRGFVRLASTFWSGVTEGRSGKIIDVALLPFGLFLACILFSLFAILIGISVVARGYAASVIEITAWAALAWLIWRAVDGISEIALESMNRRGRLGALSVVTMLRRAGKVLIVVVALIAAFDTLGVNLTGWLAALGIGGLAIALGAQKTIEHFVGSLTLIADQPIRVGDYCRIDDTLSGTVEDIGMRSTRLRTVDRTLVTIPNGLLSAARIENFASRDRYLFAPVLNLRHETTPAQLRALIDALRELLYAHARVAEDPRVRFVGFAPSSLDVELFSYVIALDFDEFLEVKEDLNLRIMDILEASGTGFAFPSQTLYLRRDAHPAASEGAAEVPHDKPHQAFTRARIDALAGSISFEPESRKRDAPAAFHRR